MSSLTLQKQQEQIKLGEDYNLDVSLYNDMDRYDWRQMKQVRLGLKWGIDVSLYNNPDKYNAFQMEQVLLGLIEDLDVSLYNDPKRYTAAQMIQIRNGLESGLDVSLYNNPKYPSNIMVQIRLGMEQGINLFQYFPLQTLANIHVSILVSKRYQAINNLIKNNLTDTREYSIMSEDGYRHILKVYILDEGDYRFTYDNMEYLLRDILIYRLKNLEGGVEQNRHRSRLINIIEQYQ